MTKLFLPPQLTHREKLELSLYEHYSTINFDKCMNDELEWEDLEVLDANELKRLELILLEDLEEEYEEKIGQLSMV